MENKIKEILLYGIVGGIATLIEWLLFYLLDEIMKVKYIPATIIAYIISTFFNWLLGRFILFYDMRKNIILEIISVYAASIVGVVLNVLGMWLLVGIGNYNPMKSKVVATVLVFGWNYMIRRSVIYKKK